MTPPAEVLKSLHFEQTAPDAWIYMTSDLATWLVEHDQATGYHLSVLQSNVWHTVLTIIDERCLAMALGGVLDGVGI